MTKYHLNKFNYLFNAVIHDYIKYNIFINFDKLYHIYNKSQPQ